MTTASHFECGGCGRQLQLGPNPVACECGVPLLVRYAMDRVRLECNRADLADAPADMWRYLPLLPVRDGAPIVSMGEGWTPLIRARRLGEYLGLADLWIKDESSNPLGSWESRGFACAASWARENEQASIGSDRGPHAAIACAAYARAAGLKASIRPRPDWPAWASLFRAYDSSGVDPAPGSIAAVGEAMCVEGLKTVAYEITEQLEWELPRVVVCPSQLGTKALQKGFEELIELDWAAGEPPEVICAPDVTPSDAIDFGLEMARLEGILPSLESAACLAALKSQPLENGAVVIVNTGSGLLDAGYYTRRLRGGLAGEPDKLGGLITPR